MDQPPSHGYGRENTGGLPAPVPLASPDPLHRPTRWVALLLSLFVPGLGHVYLGAWERGLALVAAFAALTLLAATLAPHVAAGIVLLLLSTVVLSRLVAALDALRLPAAAIKARTAGRTALDVLAGWAVFALLSIALALTTRIFFLEAFKIPAGSMRPTVEVGDHLFVDKRNKTPLRGQPMVFEFPENRQQDFIKRIVALEGDVVEIDEQGWLTVNGLKAPTCKVGEVPGSTDADGHRSAAQTILVEFLDGRPHLIARDRSFHGGMGQFGPFTVPPGNVFVLGDSRDNSHDSRGWNQGKGGGVPFDHFKGVPFLIWLSFVPHGSVVWNRVGPIDPPRLPGNPALASDLARCLASAPPSAVPARRTP